MAKLTPRRSSRKKSGMTQPDRNVALFVTCLVDLFRPSVGFAAVKLLEDAGCQVVGAGADLLRPAGLQCRRPAHTRDLAPQVIDAFEPYDYVVAPSGSCGGMITKHYPELFAERARISRGAPSAGGARLTSWSSFLTDVLGVEQRRCALRAARSPITIPARACASSASRSSRANCCGTVRGLDARRNAAMPTSAAASAALSAVKYGEISNAIVERKTEDIAASPARRYAAGRRPRLPDEHGRQALARGPRHRGASRRRSAGRHDR